jgi:hypothetical protein
MNSQTQTTTPERKPSTGAPVPCGDTVTLKAKAPVLQNTIGKAVATPTVSGVLSRPDFLGVSIFGCAYGFGHGGGYPQGRPHGFTRVLNRHAHLLRVKTQQVVLKSRKGAKTMTTTPLASRCAVPKRPQPTPGAPTPSLDPIALHCEAVNACAMASYYTRKGNHAGAARKAVQALSALRRLAAFERLEVAA